MRKLAMEVLEDLGAPECPIGVVVVFMSDFMLSMAGQTGVFVAHLQKARRALEVAWHVFCDPACVKITSEVNLGELQKQTTQMMCFNVCRS
jgi:hypothetical protein